MQYNQPYGISDPNAAYINGNPATGTMGSIPPAASIEYDQREIVNVIQYAADHGLKDYNGTLCQVPSNADLYQLLKAIFGIANKTSNILTQNVVYYVNGSTGSDSYDGTTSTVGGGHGPFASVQKALNMVGQFAPGTYGATINVAGGNYVRWATPNWAHCPVTINCAGYYGGGRTYFITSDANSACCLVQGPNNYQLNNCAVGNGGSGSCSNVVAASGATLWANNIQSEGTNSGSTSCAFGAFQGNLALGNVWLNSSSGVPFLVAGSGANLDLSRCYCTINVAMGVAAFAEALSLGNLGIQANSSIMTFAPGSYAQVAGPKFYADYNGIINVAGQGVNFFPGTAPGSTATGGQYG